MFGFKKVKKKPDIYEESQPLQKRNQFMEALTDQLNGH